MAAMQTCSVHGKQRSAESLISDGWGGLQCAPGKECKMGAAGTKRSICKFWQEGRCTQGALCSYAHGEEEIGEPGPSKGTLCGGGGSGGKSASSWGCGKGGGAGKAGCWGLAPCGKGDGCAGGWGPWGASADAWGDWGGGWGGSDASWGANGSWGGAGASGCGWGKGPSWGGWGGGAGWGAGDWGSRPGPGGGVNSMKGMMKGFGKMMAMMGMMGKGPWGGKGCGGSPSSPSQKFCAIHGKPRSDNCLRDAGDGSLVCKPGMECKGGSSFGVGGIKRTICKFWEAGECTKGQLCSYAHGQEEIGLPIPGDAVLGWPEGMVPPSEEELAAMEFMPQGSGLGKDARYSPY